MEKVKRFLSVDDVFRDVVIKQVPELKGKEIDTKFEFGLVCPNCGQKDRQGSGALFYRVNTEEKWIRVGKPLMCPKCRDAEFLNNYMEGSLAKQKQEIVTRLIRDYFFIPDGLRNAGFKNYEEINKITTRARAEAIQFTIDFLKNNKEMYNLLIMGNPGTGKTHLCSAIARTIKDKGLSVGFLTSGQILSKIKTTFNKNSKITESAIFQDIKKLDLLILDDIGSESLTGSDDWRKSMIFEVVESRSGRPTVYTTNLTDLDLPAAMGERIFSRLFNNSKFIDLFTDDYRKKLQIK